MKNTRILRILLIVSLLIVQLTILNSCKRQPEQTSVPWSGYTQANVLELPEPVLQTHKENYIFKVTWFQKPFTGYFMLMALGVDGSINRMLVSSRGERGPGPAQLTEQDREEIRTILETMTQRSSMEPFAGVEVITLSFLWGGKYYRISFNESNCPDELQRLFEIADMAWRRSPTSLTNPPWSPCRENDKQQAQEPTDSVSLSPDDLPEQIEFSHGARLFYVTWFKQPFAGIYNQLSFFSDHYMADNFLDYRESVGNGGGYAQLDEMERREVQDLLESMVNVSSLEQPMGDTIITLGFLWESDYQLLNFGDLNCSSDLQRLFDIVGIAFEQQHPESNFFQNPCQER